MDVDTFSSPYTFDYFKKAFTAKHLASEKVSLLNGSLIVKDVEISVEGPTTDKPCPYPKVKRYMKADADVDSLFNGRIPLFSSGWYAFISIYEMEWGTTNYLIQIQKGEKDEYLNKKLMASNDFLFSESLVLKDVKTSFTEDKEKKVEWLIEEVSKSSLGSLYWTDSEFIAKCLEQEGLEVTGKGVLKNSSTLASDSVASSKITCNFSQIFFPNIKESVISNFILHDPLIELSNFSDKPGLKFVGSLTLLPDVFWFLEHFFTLDMKNTQTIAIEAYASRCTEFVVPNFEDITFKGSLPSLSVNIGEAKVENVFLSVRFGKNLSNGSHFAVLGAGCDVSIGSLSIFCDFDFDTSNKSLSAQVSLPIWKDACNFKGLNLENALLSVYLSKGYSYIQCKGLFTFGERIWYLSGIIGNGFSGIYGAVSEFTLQDISTLFHEISGEETSDHPSQLTSIKFKNVSASVATDHGVIFDKEVQKGFTIAATVDINDFAELNARLNISSDGVSLKSDFHPEKKLEFGGISLLKASLCVEWYKKSSGKASTFMIEGVLSFFNKLDLDIILMYQKGSSSKFAVFAELTNSHKVSDLCSEATFLDTFRFSRLCIVYASDKFNAGEFENLPYNFVKGFQLVAEMKSNPVGHEKFSPVGKLTAHNQEQFESSPGTILRIEFGSLKSVSFSLEFMDLKIQLGESWETLPFKVSFMLSDPSVLIKFGVRYKPSQIDLFMQLQADLKEATITAGMDGSWNNPFGLSKDLSISDVHVSGSIAYANPTVPDKAAFGGKLDINQGVHLLLECGIAVNPMDMYLVLNAKNITTNDLCRAIALFFPLLAPIVANISIPDIIHINELQVYIVPHDIHNGLVNYDKGFMFLIDAKLFGNNVILYSKISEDGLILHGEMDPIDLGIFKLKGVPKEELDKLSWKQENYQGQNVGKLSEKLLVHFEISKQNGLKIKFNGMVQIPLTSIYAFVDIDSADHLVVMSKLQLFGGLLEGDICIESTEKFKKLKLEGHVSTHFKELRDKIVECLKHARESYDKMAGDAKKYLEQKRKEFDDELNKYGEEYKQEMLKARNQFDEDLKNIGERKKKLEEDQKKAEEELSSKRESLKTAMEDFFATLQKGLQESEKKCYPYYESGREASNSLSIVQKELERSKKSSSLKISHASKSVNSLSINLDVADQGIKQISYNIVKLKVHKKIAEKKGQAERVQECEQAISKLNSNKQDAISFRKQIENQLKEVSLFLQNLQSDYTKEIEKLEKSLEEKQKQLDSCTAELNRLINEGKEIISNMHHTKKTTIENLMKEYRESEESLFSIMKDQKKSLENEIDLVKKKYQAEVAVNQKYKSFWAQLWNGIKALACQVAEFFVDVSQVIVDGVLDLASKVVEGILFFDITKFSFSYDSDTGKLFAKLEIRLGDKDINIPKLEFDMHDLPSFCLSVVKSLV